MGTIIDPNKLNAWQQIEKNKKDIEELQRRFNFESKGEWSPILQYNKYDLVTINGSSYFATIANAGYSPLLNPNKWQLLVERGERGEQGSIGVAGQGTNILINGDFKINQDNVTAISDGYTVDGWKGFDGITGTVNIDKSISITSLTGYLVQLIENGKVFDNTTYTLAINVSGTIYRGTVTTGEEDGIILSIDCGGIGQVILVRVSDTEFNYAVGITGQLTNIKWVVLVLGDSVSDIFETDYTIELLRCQQYYITLSTDSYGDFAVGMGYYENKYRFVISLPTTMRKIPTIIIDGNFRLVTENNITVATNFNISRYMENNISIICDGTTELGKTALLQSDANTSKIIFDARL